MSILIPAVMAVIIRVWKRKAYLVDLQWQVGWKHITLGLKYHKIATNLGISLGTAYNEIELFKATGEVSSDRKQEAQAKFGQLL